MSSASRTDDLFATTGSGVVDPRPEDPVAEIVVVCHANVARSPLAMAMLDAVARRRRDDADDVWVRSAGVHAREGLPAAEESRRQAASRGLDLSAHRSALLVTRDVAEADLVLTMSERQRSHAVKLHPPAERWTFTLVEFARLSRALKPLDGQLGARERVRFLARLASGARPYVSRPSAPEDVADPYGGPRAGYERMAGELDRLVGDVAAQLFGAPNGREAYGRWPPRQG